MALQIQSRLLSSGTMRKWHVIISNVVEEVNFLLLEHETCGNGMNWGIAPTFIKKSSILVKRFEIIGISLRTKPIEITDLEIRPLGSNQSKFSKI
jgi:hypothetical protein